MNRNDFNHHVISSASFEGGSAYYLPQYTHTNILLCVLDRALFGTSGWRCVRFFCTFNFVFSIFVVLRCSQRWCCRHVFWYVRPFRRL